ncbi:MAG: hypothetical protein R3A80_09030 [Bdellovibrionota bacterium]
MKHSRYIVLAFGLLNVLSWSQQISDVNLKIDYLDLPGEIRDSLVGYTIYNADQKNGSLCSATKISKLHFLTAGHCFLNANTQSKTLETNILGKGIMSPVINLFFQDLRKGSRDIIMREIDGSIKKKLSTENLNYSYPTVKNVWIHNSYIVHQINLAKDGLQKHIMDEVAQKTSYDVAIFELNESTASIPIAKARLGHHNFGDCKNPTIIVGGYGPRLENGRSPVEKKVPLRATAHKITNSKLNVEYMINIDKKNGNFFQRNFGPQRNKRGFLFQSIAFKDYLFKLVPGDSGSAMFAECDDGIYLLGVNYLGFMSDDSYNYTSNAHKYRFWINAVLEGRIQPTENFN